MNLLDSVRCHFEGEPCTMLERLLGDDPLARRTIRARLRDGTSPQDLFAELRALRPYCQTPDAHDQLDEALARLLDETFQAPEAFAAVVGVLAHELRSPLAAIEGAIQIMNRRLGQPATKLLRPLSALSGASKRLSTMSKQTLDWIRQSDAQVEATAHPLASLVRDAFDHSEAALRVTLSVHGDGYVQVRPFDLTEALRNLFDNAAQARATQIVVRIDRGESFVHISIEDDGLGLAPEVEARLFRPLVSARPGGTGLGLPYARRVFEGFGGTLDYDGPATEAPHGAVFQGALPRAPHPS